MKKRNLVLGGIVVLVVLAASAFVGSQLLNSRGLLANGSGGPKKTYFTSKGSVSLEIQPSSELPQGPADVRGLFDHRQDNSIFVGAGEIRMTVQKDQSGNVTSATSHSGRTVEVIFSPRTTVYRDVTTKQFSGEPPSSKIQQVVEPGALDEIGQNSIITVWGKETSARIDADLLVYTLPPVLQAR